MTSGLFTMKLFLKILVVLPLVLVLLAFYGRGKITESHNIVRGEDYQARIHYLWEGLPEFNERLPLEDKNPIWPFRDLKNPLMDKGPYIVAYPVSTEQPAASVLILPGGGYNFRSEKQEGKMIAEWLNTQGINGYVLNYRLDEHPAPLSDARLAMSYLRHHAKRFGIDVERIGVMGFSAGGHLAASLSTLYDHQDNEPLPLPYTLSSRPDFTVLAYPVISLADEVTHSGSRNELLGDEADDGPLIMLLSTEQHVTTNTPPSFIWAPKTDGVVPYENSILYAEALKRAGVKHELHIFPEGGHGSALAQHEKQAKAWPGLMLKWLEEVGMH